MTSLRDTQPDKVDVIVPVFNGASYVEKALRSIQNQTHPVQNIIVSDDGSTDASVDVISRMAAEDARIVLLKGEHAGVSAARNRALEACSSEFVAMLDCDDVWDVQKIKKQLEVFRQSTPELGLVYCGYDFINEKGGSVHHIQIFKPSARGNIFEGVRSGEVVVCGSASGVLIRRKALTQAGLFDESLALGEDWQLWARIAEHHALDYVDEPLVHLRIHPQNSQTHYAQRQKGIWSFFQIARVFNTWHQDPTFAAWARKRLQNDCCRMAIKRIWNPSDVMSIYREVGAHDLPILNDLFRGRQDYLSHIARGMLYTPKHFVRRILFKAERQQWNP